MGHGKNRLVSYKSLQKQTSKVGTISKTDQQSRNHCKKQRRVAQACKVGIIAKNRPEKYE